MDRRSERIGGWGAVAQGALTIAGFGVGLAALVAAQRHAPEAGPALLAAAVAVLSAFAQLAAVRGLRYALRPPSRVAWAASWAGWAGALLWLTAGLVGGYGGVATPRAVALAGKIAEFAPLFTAAWAVAACAAAGRLGRLPTWLRMVGAAWGAAVLASPAFGPFRLLALLVGLAWWFGLGAELLRLSRIPAADA